MEWTNSDTINAVSAFILLIAVVVSLIIGLRSISQTHNMYKKELTTRLLGEITDWVSEIETSFLNTQFPRNCDEEAVRTVELNVLREHGIPFARKEHIMAIASFDKGLQGDIYELSFNLGIYMCLKAESMQIDGKASFASGSIRDTVDKLLKNVSEGKAKINDLVDQYSMQVTDSANKVFIRVAELTTETLKS